MSPKKTATRESAAPAEAVVATGEPPRETHPIARGPMDDLGDAMIANSHVDTEGRPMRFEAIDGALVRTDIPDRRAEDQEDATVDAFIEGTLPEDDRRRSAPPSDPEE